MTDTGGSQAASGSWEPDPTGRYRLRWRYEAGDWTDHVYGEDGTMGNDRYNSPVERLTEQDSAQGVPSPPSEASVAEQLQQFHASDTSPATHSCYKCGHTDFVYKRDRVLWHVCFWIGLFVLFLTWIALPFLPKRPYCARCGAH